MKIVILTLALLVPALAAADSCTQYGNSTYCSDGTSYNWFGNTTYGSDGTSYSRYGNTTYGSDGTSYSRFGNTTYGSDGTSYSRYGSTISVPTAAPLPVTATPRITTGVDQQRRIRIAYPHYAAVSTSAYGRIGDTPPYSVE